MFVCCVVLCCCILVYVLYKEFIFYSCIFVFVGSLGGGFIVLFFLFGFGENGKEIGELFFFFVENEMRSVFIIGFVFGWVVVIINYNKYFWNR